MKLSVLKRVEFWKILLNIEFTAKIIQSNADFRDSGVDLVTVNS